MTSTLRRPRGLSMLTVMLVVAVVTILVAAALAFTGTELGSANHQKRRERIGACAEAARNYVIAQVRSAGQGGNSTNYTTINKEWQSGDLIVRPGHLDQPTDGGYGPNAVSHCPYGTSGDRMMDLTNTTPGAVGTNDCLHYVAYCIDSKTGDKSEVEGEIYMAF